jgi:Glycosyl hydrolase catalytic core
LSPPSCYQAVSGASLYPVVQVYGVLRIGLGELPYRVVQLPTATSVRVLLVGVLANGCLATVGGTSDAGATQVGNTTPCKRGLAYGEASPAALIPGIGWWYNWSPTPEHTVQSSYVALGLEFVPIQWGGSVDAATLASQIPEGAKYLLGFNEPNFVQQSNLTPQQAAALWPQPRELPEAAD